MTITPAPTSTVSSANDIYIDGLLSYTNHPRWGNGAGVTVTYSFPQSASVHPGAADAKLTFSAVTDQNMKDLIANQIIKNYEAVANITFQLVVETSTDHADIPIAYSAVKAVSDPTSLAFSSPPAGGANADIWIAAAQQGQPFAPGTDMYETIIHELGHSLGLKHSQDSPALPLEQESQSYTVMSYTEYRNDYMIGQTNTNGDIHPETLMLDDIRALQYLYGPNFNAKSGDTTYKWNQTTGALTTTDTALDGTQTTSTMTPYTNKILMTVWDGGGTDTYDFSEYTTGVNVNLQPGAWTTADANQLPSYDVGFGPAATPPGNIANAYLYVNPATGVADLRSLIENAIGGSGDDVITGNQAKNSLIGNSGNDTLYGLDGADTLDGGLGDDYLSGDAGDDSLMGGNGKDSLYGGDGADVLDGGAGDDLLRGGAGDDTYKFGFGSGRDMIIQGDGGVDKLVFGAGVSAGAITWTRSGFDLVATLTGGSDQVTLKNWYWGAAQQLKVFLGTTELTQFGSALTDTSVATLIAPTVGGTVTAGAVRTLLTGSANTDTLNGGPADDTLVGGAGNDTLNGGGGNDLYVFNRGDGAETILDSGGSDTLCFGYGVSASDISISMSGTNIIVGVRNPASPTTTFTNLTDKLTIQNWMNASQRIETFQFADGTSLDLSGITSHFGTEGADAIDLSSFAVAFQLDSGSGNDVVTGGSNNDTISGGAGDDVIKGGDGADLIQGDVGADQLTGGLGNDTLLGGGGNDTYNFNIGDGKDWIYDYYYTSVDASGGNDTLCFGAGITINDLLISMSGKNLIIGLKNSNNPNALIDQLSDTVTIFDWLTTNHRVETFKVNNISYSAAQLVAYMGTDGDDKLTWTESAVTLNGGGGDDSLTGGAYVDALFGGDGDDTLDGGGAPAVGLDTLRGGAGDDLYLFGKGYGKVLIIQGDGGADRLQFLASVSAVTTKFTQSGADLIITWTDNTDQVTLQNYNLGGNYRLNYFFTVTTGNLASILNGSSYNDSIVGSQFDDTMTGGDGNDTLDGGAGKDTMSGGKGDDTYYVGHRSVFINAVANAAIDTVIENSGEGNDTVYSYFSDYTLTNNVENLVLVPVYPNGGATLGKGTGNDLDNSITGNGSSNILNGMGGNDTLIGGNGNDTLDGGTGDDTAIYSGTISQYSFSRQNDGSIKVTDTVSGRDGADTVSNIEHLKFSDGEIAVSANGIAPRILVSGASQITCSQSNSVKPFTGVTIQDYNTGAVETLTIKLTGGGSLSPSTNAQPNLGSEVYTLTGNAAQVSAALKQLIFTPPSGTMAPGAETTFDLSITSNAYAPAVTNSAIKVVIDNNAAILTITGDQSASVAENVSSQTAVYTAHAASSNANAAITYSITGGADASFMQITNPTDGVVTFKYTPNFESPVDVNADHTYEIIVTATDGVYTTSKNVIIEVTNADEAPVFTSRTTSSTIENRDFGVYTAHANDPEGVPVTYSITGGVDANLLQIKNPLDGVVTFKPPPDFETPRDANGDNVYQITVTASDGHNSTNIDVAISVTDVVETGLSITTGSTGFTNENTLAPVYTVAGSKAVSGGASLTYSLAAGSDAGLFNIDSTTGDVTFKNAPNYEAPGGIKKDNSYTFDVLASDGLNTVKKYVTIKVNDVPDANKTPGDFDADGHSDILLQNGANGVSFVWELDGLNVKASGGVGWTPPTNNWHAVGTGDFNGDGKSDILLQNGDDGQCFTWEMNGLTVKASGIVGWTPPTNNWRAVGTGDFNADGKSDVLLQNGANGMCFVWEMDGLNVTGSGTVGWTPPTNRWQAVGTGDFNGDGKSDILLQNADDGRCFVWEMDGLNVIASGVVGWTPPTNKWHAVGSGDFNGDGKSDILLQNGDDGQCFVWEMDGLNVIASGVVGWTPPTNKWHAVGTGDYNGDGKSDILLQNGADGACFVWEMDGLNVKASGTVGWTPPSADWHASA